ncbi:NADH dehydrogenase subunit 4L [Chelydra serpentina]|uniref:NADH dehydrogenase subunit 4L n=1 Tax=Chelydra serpentina TaxID=8475 RepID=A0A8T1SA44_CHESE|nr:NADH dehydrogenase subunit 4L [Chelydra serpentina]
MTPLHFSYYSAFTISIIVLSLHRIRQISTLLCLESIILSLFIALSIWPIQLQTSSFILKNQSIHQTHQLYYLHSSQS